MAIKFTQFVSNEVNYDFVGFRNKFLVLSGVVVLLSFVLLGTRGLNFGIDFRGGTEVQVEFVSCPTNTTVKPKNCIPKEQLRVGAIRKRLEGLFPGTDISVQQSGEKGTGFLLQFDEVSALHEKDVKLLQQRIRDVFGKMFVGADFRSEGGNKIDLTFTRQLQAEKTKTAPAPRRGAVPQKFSPEQIKKLLERLRKRVPKPNPLPTPRKVEPRKAAPTPTPAPRTVPTPRPAPARTAPAPRVPASAPSVRPRPSFQEFFAPAGSTPASANPTTGTKEKPSVLRAIDVAALQKIKDEFKRLDKLFKDLGLGEIKVSSPTRQSENRYEYSVTFSGLSAMLESKLASVYGVGLFKILQVESVGPRVGKKLRNSGIISILLANLFILIYIAIRFDFRYAPGAVVALLHDVFITAGVFSALKLPFDLAIIAALLTIVGYSLNDTIVVYDRIRENWQKTRVDFSAVINRSINETLSRTLLTSGTTFIAVVPIYIIGGDNIKWFAFAMMFGILVGTYSSIAIASPIVFYLDQYFTRKQREEDQESEEKRERRRRRRAGLAEHPHEA